MRVLGGGEGKEGKGCLNGGLAGGKGGRNESRAESEGSGGSCLISGVSSLISSGLSMTTLAKSTILPL